MRSTLGVLSMLVVWSAACDAGTPTPAGGGADPCTENNGGCSQHATCTATDGVAACACQDGYAGDGLTCRVGITQLSADNDHACVLRSDGAAYCWGGGFSGALGDGNSGDSNTPVRVAIDRPLASIAIGFDHTCGIARDGSLWCWGAGTAFPKGDGTSDDQLSPVQVGTATDWTWVAAGRGNTCAVRTGGHLWCWGQNQTGETGDGTTEPRSTPVAVLSDDTWRQVRSSTNYSCGIKTDGTLWCWGVNQGGRFLDPTDLTPQLTPIQIGTAASWKEVFPTGDGACALRQDNSLWCWGNNHFGQAGLGDTEARSEPAQVGQLKTWTSMGPAYGHTLAIQSDGSLWGWGDNFGGRLSGEVKSGDRVLKPRQLAKDSQWLLAAGGGLFSCAVRTDATAWCWGNNAAGQVGAGRGGGSFREPQRVLLPEE